MKVNDHTDVLNCIRYVAACGITTKAKTRYRHLDLDDCKSIWIYAHL